MKNPNDATAEYYDAVLSLTKGSAIVTEELQMIHSIASPGAKILDIGCGTGRHLIPLVKEGYRASGIDSSPKLLEILKEKLPDAEIFCEDILAFNEVPEKFDLITMFWNTFNEICLTGKDARNLLEKCIAMLNIRGSILINMDNPAVIDFSSLEFSAKLQKGLDYSWKVISYDPVQKISVSVESIREGERTVSTEITQRWWSVKEIMDLLPPKAACSILHNRLNKEIYLQIHV
jgi:SAM-dependent methyltransferase